MRLTRFVPPRAALPAVVVVALTLAAAAAVSGARGQDALGGWGSLPRELVDILAKKASAYAVRALDFTCFEEVRRAEYKNEDALRQIDRRYEYLLIPDPTNAGGYRALRSKPGSEGRNEERVNLGFPEPFLWTQIFDPAIASTFKFKVGEWRTTPWDLVRPITWISSAPLREGNRVTEWSGTVEVEFDYGNIVSVRAEPNLQEETINAALDKYLQAFRILGFSTAAPPIGRELTAQFEFKNEEDGLRYPSRVEMRRFRQVSKTYRTTKNRQRVDYVDYRFFVIREREEIPPFDYDPEAAAAAAAAGDPRDGSQP